MSAGSAAAGGGASSSRPRRVSLLDYGAGNVRSVRSVSITSNIRFLVLFFSWVNARAFLFFLLQIYTFRFFVFSVSLCFKCPYFIESVSFTWPPYTFPCTHPLCQKRHHCPGLWSARRDLVSTWNMLVCVRIPSTTFFLCLIRFHHFHALDDTGQKRLPPQKSLSFLALAVLEVPWR